LDVVSGAARRSVTFQMTFQMTFRMTFRMTFSMMRSRACVVAAPTADEAPPTTRSE